MDTRGMELTLAEMEMIQQSRAQKSDSGPRPGDTVRPVFVREPTRDENGLPQSVNQPKGEAKNAASARPVYRAPLRNPALDPGAPPPNLNYYNHTGTWAAA